MSRTLTPAEESDARKCFAYYEENGQMPTADLGGALRSLGVNPSDSEVKAFAAEVGNPPTIDFNTFLRMLAKEFKPADPAEEIREIFKTFDRDGNGTISATEFKQVLMTMGLELSDEEVGVMIQDRDPEVDSEGKFYYEQFIKIMTSK